MRIFPGRLFRFARRAAALAAAAFCAGCVALGPDFEPPAWDGPERWTVDAPPASPLPGGAPCWSVFGDPALDALEEALLAQSPSLAAAVARLDAAAAQLGVARADAWPSATAAAASVRERKAAGSDPAEDPAETDWLHSASLSCQWELDFWGRVRRNAEAAKAECSAAARDVQAARTLLSSQLAAAYVSLRTLQAQLVCARRNEELQASTLALVESRIKNGLAGDLDLAQAEMNLAATRAAIPDLETRLAAALHAICAPVFAIASATETALVDDEFYYDFTPLFSVRGYPEPSFAITSSLPDGAWGVAGSKIAFTPSATGTVTFACTASNTVGDSACTLTVAVVRPVPAAPAWSSFPTPLIPEDGHFDFIPANYLFPGHPVPGIELTSPATAADPGDYSFEDGQFAFDPSSGPGSYPFVFTASNTAGAADATLLVTVVSTNYTAWLTANILPEDTSPADTAPNDHTYSENYVADVPPAYPFLSVTFDPAADGTLSIDPFSTNRVYQLLYWTDLGAAPVTNDLDPTNLFFPTDATGFGRILVTHPSP